MTPVRLIGAAIIFLCAMATVREYGTYCRKRIAQSAAFLAFVRHVGERVCVYLMPIGSAALEFEDTELSAVGFLGAVRSGGTVYSAFTLARDKLLFSDEQKAYLSSLFKELGCAYIEDERVRVEKATDTLSRLHAEEERKAMESEKVVRTLILALALGIIVLIL